jgi:hypothetical protein
MQGVWGQIITSSEAKSLKLGQEVCREIYHFKYNNNMKSVTNKSRNAKLTGGANT